MRNESVLPRLRAFRVIDHNEGLYCTHIVIEDVDQNLFRSLNLYIGSPDVRQRVGNIDEQDAQNALASLKNFRLYTENYPDHWPVQESIDATIDQYNRQARQIRDQARQVIRRAWSDKESAITEQGAKGSIRMVADRELKDIAKEVWNFAGGRRLAWKPFGLTPAGRKVDVLTFDGVDEVLIGPTSIEAPSL